MKKKSSPKVLVLSLFMLVGLLMPSSEANADCTGAPKYKDRFCLFGGDRCMVYTSCNGDKRYILSDVRRP